MFIIVKYGRNETLLCNPMCAVINLLTSIKRRAGYANTNVIVDLSDETGLVKELDTHKYDSANKHLDSHATYVLVQKEILTETEIHDNQALVPPSYQYRPLLEHTEDTFPNFQIRSVEVQRPTKSKSRTGKSPSPAGRYSTTNKAKKTIAASGRLSRKK